LYQNLAPLPPPSNVKPHEKAKQQKAKCAEVEALTNLSNQNNISTLDQLKDSLSKIFVNLKCLMFFKTPPPNKYRLLKIPRIPVTIIIIQC